jgi:LacI family transcriptional regulator
LKDFGLSVDEKLFQQGQFTLESGREAAKTLLRMNKRPTAIFAASDQMAAGVLGEAQSMGMAVPEQLSVAGVDDSVIAKIVWPQMTTCNQPIKKMAYAALSILLLGEQDESPQNLLLEHKLVVRGSTSPPQGTRQRRSKIKFDRDAPGGRSTDRGRR